MLAVQIPHQGGRPNADSVSALQELGIEQHQSKRWQKVAGVPAKVVDEHATRCELTPGVGAWRYDFETMPNSRRVHPPVLVTVTTTTPWPVGDWSGLLSHWRRDADGWRGFVAFSTGVGQQRLGWFPAEQLSPGLPLGRDEVREVRRTAEVRRPALPCLGRRVSWPPPAWPSWSGQRLPQ